MSHLKTSGCDEKPIDVELLVLAIEEDVNPPTLDDHEFFIKDNDQAHLPKPAKPASLDEILATHEKTFNSNNMTLASDFRLTVFGFKKDGLLVRLSPLHGAVQPFVPTKLLERVIYLSHSTLTQVHRRETKTYQTLR